MQNSARAQMRVVPAVSDFKGPLSGDVSLLQPLHARLEASDTRSEEKLLEKTVVFCGVPPGQLKSYSHGRGVTADQALIQNAITVLTRAQ